MPEIIKLLRQIRLEKRIGQEELAISMGLGENQVANWERGVYVPTLANAIRWAEALGYEFELMLIQTKEPANV